MLHADTNAILAVAVGNTRTRLGLFQGKDLRDPVSLPSDDVAEVLRAARALTEDQAGVVVAMSSVRDDAAQRIANELASVGEVFRVGTDIPIPLRHSLDDASTLGQDRALCALAAFSRAEQACVVIDAGTAITVDFVDGEGVFHGGVIAPGLRMMLKSLHSGASALPDVAWELPDPARGPFGKDTRHAMLLGVRASAVGLVRTLVEQYATHYEAYPQVIATGGDAPALFEHDEVVEHIVPDLQLIGIYEACKAAAEDSADAPGDAPDDTV